jgi:hypothetical protein
MITWNLANDPKKEEPALEAWEHFQAHSTAGRDIKTILQDISAQLGEKAVVDQYHFGCIAFRTETKYGFIVFFTDKGTLA